MHSYKKRYRKNKTKIYSFVDSNYDFEYKIFPCEIKKLHPSIEIKRFQLLNQIKNNFFQLINDNIESNNLRSNTKNLKQLSNEFIIRYLFLGISENKNTIDPLFSYKYKNYIQIKKDISNIILNDPDNLILDNIINNLNLNVEFNKSINEVKKFIKKNTFKKPEFKVITYFKNNIEYKKIWFDESFIIINNVVETKLRKNYKGNMENFDSMLWCLIFRYFMINDNNQLILNIHNELDKYYNNYFELFASSINSYKMFCSLFYDIEKYFQSFGNFFNMKINRGFYKANMPYDEEIMKNTCIKLVNMVKKSNQPLACLICMPVWDYEGKLNINPNISNYNFGKYEALEVLKNSNLITYQKILSKNQINYLSINNMKKIPASSTYIIVIENKYSKLDFNTLNKFSYL
jgi:hypothetical protein